MLEICRCSSAVGAGLLKDLIASHADELCKVLKIALETRNEQKFNEVTESAGFEISVRFLVELVRQQMHIVSLNKVVLMHY